MTGAMYAAIAGLKTHMQNLNVIGNNIANVNTNGYKAGRSVFRSALYSTISGGSNGTDVVGGQNPSQIGYGVSLATVDIDMSTGNYGLTGKATDCMIDGDGFFLVGSKSVANSINANRPNTFKNLTLTRVGNFEFKADGYLTDNGGNVVYGFLSIGETSTGEPILCDQLVPIRLPRMETIQVEAEDEDGNIKLQEKVIIHYPTQTGTNAIQDDTLPFGAGADYKGEQLEHAIFNSVSIDPATGKITGITSDDQTITVGYMAIGTVTNPNGVTQQSNTYYKCGDGAGDLAVTLLGGASTSVYIGATPEGGNLKKDDATGNIDYVTRNPGADDSGLTLGMTYVNGSMVAEADKANLSNKAKVKDGGTTALMTGGLEMSKTDLATEISGLITTQRGYQANTRIVTVTDSMLEELVNMKR